VARVALFIPDLLFGSNVVGAVQAAGHEPVLIADVEGLRRELPFARALIVDLTAYAAERIEQVRIASPPGLRTLAYYSHVETDVRERAERAAYDLIVPRSRMAREGGALVDRLLAPSA
jgi:hypothetical protein